MRRKRRGPIVPDHPTEEKAGGATERSYARCPAGRPLLRAMTATTEIALAAVVIGALLTIVGSFLRRMQNRQMRRLWDEQKRLRGESASRRKPD